MESAEQIDIKKRIEFCSKEHLLGLEISPNSPHLNNVIPRSQSMCFQLKTKTGILIKVEDTFTDLLYGSFEDWMRYVVVTGIIKKPHLMQVKLVLSTPTADPFKMILPDWYNFTIRIPSHLPVRPVGMYRNLRVHTSSL